VVVPSRCSSTSQPPAAPRQTTVAGLNASGGQPGFEPLQLSTRVPAGFTATLHGNVPTDTVPTTLLLVLSITDTVPLLRFVT
jgi:hypothetical protein